MGVRKDERRGTWLVKLHYTNRDGETVDSTKRGFKSKSDALAWEREFLAKESRSTSMTFEKFAEVYADDVRPRLRETTWNSKQYVIEDKLLPFFGKMRVVDITSRDIMDWQNELLRAKDENGKKFSETYIRTVENQLSAILNHAVKHEVDWREGNPRAQELWAAAWDISNGFEAASAAMQDYVAYRDARLKPG